jgi:hypothetical protein
VGGDAGERIDGNAEWGSRLRIDWNEEESVRLGYK